MLTLRTGLATAAAAVLATGLTIAATQGSSHAATAVPAVPPVIGGATLHTPVNLLPPGSWVSTPLRVHLPRAGTYELDANVRGALVGSYPINTWILARLWNGSTGTPVRFSTRIVNQVFSTGKSSASTGSNITAPIDEWVTVFGPTTITLQAENVGAGATTAGIFSDGNGYTTLRWTRVS